MKTSIFDMNFVLPPLIEMTQVEKDMPPTFHPTYLPFSAPCGPGHL